MEAHTLIKIKDLLFVEDKVLGKHTHIKPYYFLEVFELSGILLLSREDPGYINLKCPNRSISICVSLCRVVTFTTNQSIVSYIYVFYTDVVIYTVIVYSNIYIVIVYSNIYI